VRAGDEAQARQPLGLGGDILGRRLRGRKPTADRGGDLRPNSREALEAVVAGALVAAVEVLSLLPPQAASVRDATAPTSKTRLNPTSGTYRGR
jgi:hypothetical protein